MGCKPDRLVRKKGCELSHRREEGNPECFSKKAQICSSVGNEQFKSVESVSECFGIFLDLPVFLATFRLPGSGNVYEKLWQAVSQRSGQVPLPQ